MSTTYHSDGRGYFPWKGLFFWKVAICVRMDSFGAGYRFVRYKNNSMIVRFWTQKQAQRYADQLNGVSKEI